MTAGLQRGDPSFGLADQLETQEPSDQREFDGLHGRVGREVGLMATATALIALEPPAIDQPMLVALATRTPEPIGPAGLLQRSLTVLFCAIQPLELRQGATFWELNGIARHGFLDTPVPV